MKAKGLQGEGAPIKPCIIRPARGLPEGAPQTWTGTWTWPTEPDSATYMYTTSTNERYVKNKNGPEPSPESIYRVKAWHPTGRTDYPLTRRHPLENLLLILLCISSSLSCHIREL